MRVVYQMWKGEDQMASVTNPQDLCDLLRTENACHVGFYEHCAKAADLIEAQAARIAELELERNHLSARMNRARITIGALEAGYANDLNGDLELLHEHIKDLVADRDSWRDQCSQRVEDWSKEHERVTVLEAQLRERGEPIYQIQQTSSRWTDVDKFAFDHWPSDKRIVYAHPPAAAASEDKRDAELWRKWTPYLRTLRRVPFGLAKDVDSASLASKEKGE
jgi:hypothetical protein